MLTKDGKILIRRDVRFNDFEQPKEFSKRDLSILYSEEEWNKYVHSIEDDKNQFFDEEDKLINIAIEDKEELFKIKHDVHEETSTVSLNNFETNAEEEIIPSIDSSIRIDESSHSEKKTNSNKNKDSNNDKFTRITRSKTKQINGINYVLKKDEDVRSIATPMDCREALDPNNPHRLEWLKAINKEIDAMLSIKVFETISAEEARNKRAFKSRMVFKVKVEPDNSIVFKARYNFINLAHRCYRKLVYYRLRYW